MTMEPMTTNQEWKIGDCLELLPEIEDNSIDLILTDLPYGTTPLEWDKIIRIDCLWKEYKRIIKEHCPIVLTSNQPFTSKLVTSNPTMFKFEYIWKKSIGTNFLNAKIQPLRKHENILVFYTAPIKTYIPQMETGNPYNISTSGKDTRKKSNSNASIMIKKPNYNQGTRYPSTVIEIPNTNHHSIHQTQKPVTLFEYLIKTYTNEGDTVHDSCLGSGTTLEACRNTNRNCIGFEISDEWEQHYTERTKKIITLNDF